MIYITTYHNSNPPVEELYQEWTEIKPQWTRKQSNIFWVVANDFDKIVGALVVVIINDPIWNRKWGLVENVYVLKEFRKQGIASRMMHQAEFQARFMGCEFVKLTSGKDKIEGHKLYKSLEYKEGCSFKKGLKVD